MDTVEGLCKANKKPFGTLIGALKIAFEHPNIADEIAIPIVARVHSNIEILPDRISMTNLRMRAGKLTQMLQIRSLTAQPANGPRDLEVRTC